MSGQNSLKFQFTVFNRGHIKQISFLIISYLSIFIFLYAPDIRQILWVHWSLSQYLIGKFMGRDDRIGNC